MRFQRATTSPARRGGYHPVIRSRDDASVVIVVVVHAPWSDDDDDDDDDDVLPLLPSGGYRGVDVVDDAPPPRRQRGRGRGRGRHRGVPVGDDGENANADVQAALRIECRRAVDDAAISANAFAVIDQPRLRRWWLEDEMMPTEFMVGVV